jgi:signal transduction histidine kinase
MKRRNPALLVPVVGGLAVILVVLAVLQVRWIDQVSDAERERLQVRLSLAISRFQRAFEDDLLDVCWAFVGDVPSPSTFAERYNFWQQTSPHPGLVSKVFLWQANRPKGSRLLGPSEYKDTFEPAPWPPELSGVKGQLEKQAGFALSVSQAARVVNRWTLDEPAAAFVHLFIDSSSPSGPRVSGALIAELSLPTIQRLILPRLVRQFFGGSKGLSYRIWIVAGTHSQWVLYQSVANPPSGEGSDAVVPLIPRLVLSGTAVSAEAGGLEPAASRDSGALSISPFSGARHAPPVIVASAREGGWLLIARHPAGSVAQAVRDLRRRDLTVSMGVLALLALSIAIIVVFAQRAHRLARLQMSLVAGVSHDLRTPLAVIRSAAENLADGVVSDSAQVQQYGALIREEDRKLSEMVGQVLAFAAEQSRYRKYEARAFDVVAGVENALAAARPVLKSSSAKVEKQFDAGLPMVCADISAFCRCVENLISNAARYGGRNPWIGVRVRLARAPGGREVQIQVQDHGQGIHPDDLPFLFEPFYRGKAARNVPGTGLGLSLARETAEAMGGRLTVQSEFGRGSCFTLHLPPAPEGEPAEVEALER